MSIQSSLTDYTRPLPREVCQFSLRLHIICETKEQETVLRDLIEQSIHSLASSPFPLIVQPEFSICTPASWGTNALPPQPDTPTLILFPMDTAGKTSWGLPQLQRLSEDAEPSVYTALYVSPKTALNPNLFHVLMDQPYFAGVFSLSAAGEVALASCLRRVSRSPLVSGWRPANNHWIHHIKYQNSHIYEESDPFYQIEIFAKTPLPILISGPAGTGKKTFAMLIHNRSAQNPSLFIPVYLESIPRDKQGEILFGKYENGTWQHGLLHQAAGGTIYLDEPFSLEPTIQQHLGNALSTGKYKPWPYGPMQPLQTRVIAGTRLPLEKILHLAESGNAFLYNISRVHIQIPPIHFAEPNSIKELFQDFLHEIGAAPTKVEEPYWNEVFKLNSIGNLHELRSLAQRSYFIACHRLSRKTQKTPGKITITKLDLDQALAMGISIRSEIQSLQLLESHLGQFPRASLAELHHIGFPEEKGDDLLRHFIRRDISENIIKYTAVGILLESQSYNFPHLYSRIVAELKKLENKRERNNAE